MCPIRVSPEVPVYVSASDIDLCFQKPTQEEFTVIGEKYVLPCGKPPDYTVRVDGYLHSPGGMLGSPRLTSGPEVDEITLTTPEDTELYPELRVSAICVDGVLYEAENPKE